MRGGMGKGTPHPTLTLRIQFAGQQNQKPPTPMSSKTEAGEAAIFKGEKKNTLLTLSNKLA